MEAWTVEVVPVGDVDARHVESAREALAECFPLEVRTAAREPLPEDAYDEDRFQYDAEELLIGVADDRHRIAIVEAGLFYESENFLFGMALVDGPVSVLSTTRLRDGAPDDGASVGARVRKQAVKQVGRMFGLEECDRDCVNRPTPTIEDLDRVPETFCRECRRTLGLPEEPGVDDDGASANAGGGDGAEEAAGSGVGGAADPGADDSDDESAGEHQPRAVAPTKADIAEIEQSDESTADRKDLGEDLVDKIVSTTRLVALVASFVGVFLVVGAGTFWLVEDVLGISLAGAGAYGAVVVSFLLAAYLTWELRNVARAAIARVRG